MGLMEPIESWVRSTWRRSPELRLIVGVLWALVIVGATVAGALWLLCFLPIAFYFNLYRGPNTVPLAAMVFLGVTLADLLRGKRLIPGHVDHAHLV